MENMKFNDKCIGFVAEPKWCGSLAQFLGKGIMPSDAKDLVQSMEWLSPWGW